MKKNCIPFLDYPGQLKKLKEEKNLIIYDTEYEKFISLMSTFSYYEIVNRYKKMFNVNTDDKFPDSTHLNVFFYTHSLQIDFHQIILKYIMIIERSFRTKLSYTIAKNIGETQNDYLNLSNYISKRIGGKKATRPKKMQIISKIKEEFDLLISKRGTSCYYFENSNKYIPPWILFSEIKFSSVINIFGILHQKNRSLIVNDFNICLTHVEFMDALILLKEYRNKIAHSRKIEISAFKSSIPTNILTKYLNDDDITFENNSMMAVILAIYDLLIIPEFQRKFLKEIIKFIFNESLESQMNIPDLKVNYIFNGKTFYELLELPNTFMDILIKLSNKK